MKSDWFIQVTPPSADYEDAILKIKSLTFEIEQIDEVIYYPGLVQRLHVVIDLNLVDPYSLRDAIHGLGYETKVFGPPSEET